MTSRKCRLLTVYFRHNFFMNSTKHCINRRNGWQKTAKYGISLLFHPNASSFSPAYSCYKYVPAIEHKNGRRNKRCVCVINNSHGRVFGAHFIPKNNRNSTERMQAARFFVRLFKFYIQMNYLLVHSDTIELLFESKKRPNWKKKTTTTIIIWTF